MKVKINLKLTIASLIILAFSGCVSTNKIYERTPSQASQNNSLNVNGVRFNPEIYNEKGQSLKDSWLNWYSDFKVQEQAKQELLSIKKNTNLNALSLTISANQQIAWPTPNANELKNLVDFINDSNDLGLKVILLVSTPCVIPNSAFPLGSAKEHVGGHHKGDVVNGTTLYWDVPVCADNSIDVAKNWYGQILTTLSKNLKSRNGIVYFGLLGNPSRPFATEMNLFFDGYPQLKEAQKYVSELVPYLKSQSSFPIGISLLPAYWSNDSALRYSFLKNLSAAVDLSNIDFLDITSSDQIDVAAIVEQVGHNNSNKIILSDFKVDESTQAPESVVLWQRSQALTYHLAGTWMWEYRDDPSLGNQGFGIRKNGQSGVDDGWKINVISELK